MSNIKFTQVNSLPAQSEKGCVYFVSDGTLHLGKSDGAYLEVGKSTSDVLFVTSLPMNKIEENKLYVLLNENGLTIYIYDGSQFIELSPSAHQHEVSDINNLQAILDTKLDSALLTVLSNRLDNHELAQINSQAGLHGIRLWDNKLEHFNNVDNTWTEVELSSVDISTIQLSANQIIESSTKQFIDAVLKSQIINNTNNISTYGQRIADLENLLDESSGTDEKVKLNENDNSGFLEDKIDGTSIRNINGKLAVASLDGLTATITELNLLQGVSSNIQAQIDSLNAVGNFTTSVDTKLELEALTDMKANDMVIVLEDETINESPTSIYIYNGTTWTFAGFFKGGELRDFTINPIDLIAESKGTLPKTRYELQTALDTSFVDSTGSIKSMNVQDGLKEVFQFSDNVRKQWSNVIGAPLTSTDKLLEQIVKYEILMENIALALTEKGVPTYSHNKLNEIPSKISAIASTAIEAGLNKTPKLTVTTPFTYDIILNESLSHNNIATSLIKFEDGSQNVMHYDMNFENSDEDKFINNPNVTFGGKLKLANNSNFNMTKDDSWQGEDNLYRYTVVRDEWTSIDKIEVM